jgi:ATP-dependent Lhr-like helicase
LSARVQEYDPQMLDMLSLTGRAMWGRLSLPVEDDSADIKRAARPVRTTPIAIIPREDADLWMSLASPRSAREERLSAYAQAVLATIDARGASFLHEIVSGARLLVTQVEVALAELVAHGLITADSYTGLRALLVPAARRKPVLSTPRMRPVAFGVESAGRWGRFGDRSLAAGGGERDQLVMRYAKALLARYGVVFNKLLARDTMKVPWRELLLVYRRLEARGEIRGGRFLAGTTGEQFALPDAVARLRAMRRTPKTGKLVAISAADPLNLTGVVLPGERIPALAGNRIVFEDGVPVAGSEADEITMLVNVPPERVALIESALVRKPVSTALRVRLGMRGRTPPDFSLRSAERASRSKRIRSRDANVPNRD